MLTRTCAQARRPRPSLLTAVLPAVLLACAPTGSQRPEPPVEEDDPGTGGTGGLPPRPGLTGGGDAKGGGGSGGAPSAGGAGGALAGRGGTGATAGTGGTTSSDAAADAHGEPPPTGTVADASAGPGDSGSPGDRPAPPLPGATGTLLLYAQDGGKIQPIGVDRATGALSKRGAGVGACRGAIHLLTDRAQRLLYGACPGDRGLVVLRIDRRSGALTRAGLATGGTAVGLGVHPTGGFAVTSDYDGGATLYRIAADGTPTRAQGVGAAANPHGAHFDGLGKYAYVTNAGSNSIHQFAFDGSRLTALRPATVSVVGSEPSFGGRKEPRYLTHSPDGKFIYVVGQRPPAVFAFKVGADGTLTKVGGGVSGLEAPADRDINGKDVVLHPSGAFLYASVYANNTVAVFAVDATTGALTFKKAVGSGGRGLSQLAVDPAGQFLFGIHQSSHDVVAFRIDRQTGLPTAVPGKVTLGNGTEALTAVTLAD
jgi:6-phosphogluconolactonase (cycloisomerase 2 family)